MKRSFFKPGVVVCALAGIPVGLGVFTFGYAEGGSYFSDDPKACVNCHIMRDEYDSWQKASHHAVATCNDCHTPHEFVGKYETKGRNGFWHSYYFTFQNFHEPIQISDRSARILRANCLDCHRELMDRVAGHLGSFGEPSIDCLHCHTHSGHGPPR
ncbi:MAG TPA: cytochrome c nitrite reductase small subunit [Gemmataceae bacterium]|jgi:cytochrome c nitrite reductase small subunit|nr:cytochrome c nitrite reductase small subunit [Gemmataceae bacterium]